MNAVATRFPRRAPARWRPLARLLLVAPLPIVAAPVALVPISVLAAPCGLAVAAAPGPRAEEDAREALRRLESPSAEERRRAEVWLGRHLGVEHLAELAEAHASLGLEARARLSSAIGSDDGHLALAALLASERDPELAELGAGALRRLIERWWGSSELPPSDARAVAAALDGHFSDRLFAMTVGARSLDEELGLVVRHLGVPEGLPGAGAVPVALDPVLHVAGLEAGRERPGARAAAEAEAGRPQVLHPEELLLAVIDAGGEATLEGFSMDNRRSWLHVVHRGRAGTRDGSALLVEWCRTLVLQGEESGARGARAEGAARALAGTGWPAALEWLGQRWVELGDRRALSGLLLAAERGRVAPALTRRDSVERVLAAADEAIARGGPIDLRFAEEVQRALGAIGALADGGDLGALLAAGFERAAPRGQRLRLWALADHGRMPETLAAALRARLERPAPARGPALTVDAVRALALAPPRPGAPVPFVLRDPSPLFERDSSAALYPLQDHWLVASGARPPEAWRDPAAVPLPEGTAAILRARLVDWWLAVEPDAETAARHLLALVAAVEALDDPLLGAAAEANAGERLGDLDREGGGGRLERLFERARQRSGEAERLARLEVLAGGGSERARALLLQALLTPRPAGGPGPGPRPSGVVDAADLQVLGALAADPEGEAGAAARQALLADLRARVALGDPGEESPAWLDTVERTLERIQGADVRRGQRRRVEEEFLAGLRTELRDSNHPAVVRLRTGTWPRLPRLDPLPLEALEVRLEP